MMRGVVLVATAIAVAAGPAAGQVSNPACAPRAVVLERLAERHGEEPVGSGLAGGGMVLEVLVSARTGSWTILISRPDGVACLLASGRHWEGGLTAPGAKV